MAQLLQLSSIDYFISIAEFQFRPHSVLNFYSYIASISCGSLPLFSESPWNFDRHCQIVKIFLDLPLLVNYKWHSAMNRELIFIKSDLFCSTTSPLTVLEGHEHISPKFSLPSAHTLRCVTCLQVLVLR